MAPELAIDASMSDNFGEASDFYDDEDDVSDDEVYVST
mgnify:CR=1 FL=1